MSWAVRDALRLSIALCRCRSTPGHDGPIMSALCAPRNTRPLVWPRCDVAHRLLDRRRRDRPLGVALRPNRSKRTMTTMTAEADKALVVRFVEEFWSKGNLAAADEL